MNSTAVYLFAAALFCCTGPFGLTVRGQTDSDQLGNPLGEPAIQLRDPFILADSKGYFLFGSPPSGEGFQCYVSPDLAHWKLNGWAWRISPLRVARSGLGSPQVFLYRGMYCLVYCGRMPGGKKLALAAATGPEGPYHDLHAPWLNLGDECSGGDVFVDDNGKAYLLFSRRSPQNRQAFAVFGARLNEDLSNLAGTPTPLLQPRRQHTASGKMLQHSQQGARIFKIGSKYYLTYTELDLATGTSTIRYATADKPLGPWNEAEDNPLLADRQETKLQNPAQASVFRSRHSKEWFIVYQNLDVTPDAAALPTVNIDRLELQSIRTLIVRKTGLASKGSIPTQK